MIMFGRNITLPMEAVIPRPMETCESGTPGIDDYVINLQERMNKSHILARKHLKQNSEYQKRHYDLKAIKRTLQVGVCHKLTSKWKGPYVITRKLDDITCLVKNSRKQPGKVYHIDRLLLYSGRIHQLGSPEGRNNDCLIKAGAPGIVESITVVLE
jgi:hypothetical protein